MVFNPQEIRNLKLYVGANVPRIAYWKSSQTIDVSFNYIYSMDDQFTIEVFSKIQTIKEAKLLMQEIQEDLEKIGFINCIKQIKEE